MLGTSILRPAARRRPAYAAALALVVFTLAAPASAPAAEPVTLPADSQTPFTRVLLRNWDRWDGDRDGALSKDEVDRAVADPACKGDDAAAAAALKLLGRSTKLTLPPLTKDYFADYARAAARGPATRPAGSAAEDATTVAGATGTVAARSRRLPADWDLYFAAGQKRIGRAAGPALPAAFRLDDMHQGPLGDCFFVAAVGSMVAHDPDRLRSMVAPLPEGGYRVSFPHTRPIVLPRLTDGQLAISSTTEASGPWLAVVEQAFGRYRSLLKGGPEDVEGTDVLRRGGDSAPTITHLTGHATRRVRFPKSAEEREASTSDVLPGLRKELTSAIADKRLITAGVDPPASLPAAPGTDPATRPARTLPAIPPGILKRHVYAVVGYDPATDVVEIWNPHGQSFTPAGPDGLTHGYTTKHGLFKLPLGDAFRFYTSFTFELPEQAPKGE